METWVAKIICLCLLLVLTLLFGLIPIQVFRSLRKRQLTSRVYRKYRIEFLIGLLNCFAGGVFLGTTLLHLIPEVREAMEDNLAKSQIKTHFALPEFVVGGGFFLIMLIENFIMALQHHQRGRHRFDSTESTVCFETDPQQERLLKEEPEKHAGHSSYGSVDNIENPKRQISFENKANTSSRSQADHDVTFVGKGKKGDCQSRMNPGCSTRDEQSRDGREGHDDSSNHHHHHHHHPIVEVSPEKLHATGGDDGLGEGLHDEGRHPPPPPHRHEDGCGSAHPAVLVERGDCVHVIHPNHHRHHHTGVDQLASIRSFLLLVALSLHTVFEGLAIGLQPSTEDTWNLFIAIVVHKSVIAFSMGVQFADSLRSFGRAAIFIVVFAAMSPLGVAIGTGIFEAQGGGDATGLVSAILQGVAAGTFLYVTFFEVLQKELGQDHSLLKVLFTILGYSAIVLLNLFNAEPEH